MITGSRLQLANISSLACLCQPFSSNLGTSVFTHYFITCIIVSVPVRNQNRWVKMFHPSSPGSWVGTGLLCPQNNVLPVHLSLSLVHLLPATFWSLKISCGELSVPVTVDWLWWWVQYDDHSQRQNSWKKGRESRVFTNTLPLNRGSLGPWR